MGQRPHQPSGQLNTIHNAGIRIVPGAYRTSRIEGILAEAGEPSLSRRLRYFIASYWDLSVGIGDHPMSLL